MTHDTQRTAGLLLLLTVSGAALAQAHAGSTPGLSQPRDTLDVPQFEDAIGGASAGDDDLGDVTSGGRQGLFDVAFIADLSGSNGQPHTGVAHVALYWENDGSFIKPFDNSDRNYTNGVKAELSFAPVNTPKPAAWLGTLLGYDAPRSAYGLRVTHLMHTPSDIGIAAPQPDDHPWSGHLGFAGFVQLAQPARADSVERMDHIEAALGWVGERAGAAGLQTFVHAAATDQVKPVGWGNQLSNELTVAFSWERRWRAMSGVLGESDTAAGGRPGAVRGLGWDVIPSVGISAGTPRVFAHFGVGVRLGWNLPGDFGPARLDAFRDATWDTLRPASDRERGPWSVYGFVELSGRAVVWDMFLEGNAFADGPDGVDARTWVGDVYVGCAARYRWLEIAWGFTFENERFDGQDGGHSYGTVRLGASFQY